MWQRSAVRFALALRCTRVALTPPHPSPFSASSRGGRRSGNAGGGISSGWALSKNIFEWYPRRAGEFLANTMVGHSAFIRDTPTRFDAVHAQHFSLVEGLTITPLYTLAIVHYFSVFCQYPTRVEVLRPMLDELGQKSELQCRWLLIMQTKKTPMEVIVWRCALLTLQIILFPMWLFLSSAAPQLVHATASFSSHILHKKYGCLNASGGSAAGGRAAVVPEFVSKAENMYAEKESFHEAQSTALPTDIGVAIVLLLLLLFLAA